MESENPRWCLQCSTIIILAFHVNQEADRGYLFSFKQLKREGGTEGERERGDFLVLCILHGEGK